MNATQIILQVLTENVENEIDDLITNEALANLIAGALVQAGKLQSDTPTPETEQTADKP